MTEHTTIETLIDGISVNTLRGEIASLKCEADDIASKIQRREMLLAWKEESSVASTKDPESGELRDHQESLDRAATSAPRARNGKPLRGAAAIRYVLSVDDRETWNPTDMKAALAEHGIETKVHSVQVAMSRMYRDGEFTKPEDGVYVPKSSEGKPESPSILVNDGGEKNS